jgi:hypothetical protein
MAGGSGETERPHRTWQSVGIRRSLGRQLIVTPSILRWRHSDPARRARRPRVEGVTAGLRPETGAADSGNGVVEEVYGITSLPRERADARTQLGGNSDYWDIENGLHGVRDGTLGEDASRIRTGTATMAVLIQVPGEGVPFYPGRR